MNSRAIVLMAVFSLFITAVASGQGVTLPPSGANQKSSVTQWIGPVKVTIDYSSPDVHSPTGEDRRGKIWGQLVPWGAPDTAFGTCTECPWRAGANENTVFTTSHDVKINGQDLKAGSYGVHMIPAQSGDWTLIFSKNSASWGSFFYDPSEDALRVMVQPSKAEFNEWLTYEFIDRKGDQATAALKWEEIQVPFTISVPNATDLYIARISDELRSSPGFQWQNWNAAAQYALQQKRYDQALEWATAATSRTFIGQENFNTLSTLADAQEAKGMTADAKATREKAFNHPTATAIDLHQYARQQLTRGNKQEAIRVWELNAKRFPNAWPVHVGLARGYSAAGKYKQALRHAKLALAQAPDDINKRSLEAAVKKLEQNQDWN
jgi:hypothetical protein